MHLLQIKLAFLLNTASGICSHSLWYQLITFSTLCQLLIFRKPAYTYIVVVAITVHLPVKYCNTNCNSSNEII